MNKRCTTVIMSLLWLWPGIGTAFSGSADLGGEETREPQKEESARPPIIRSDLLDVAGEKGLPQVRDIFVPKPAVSVSSVTDRPDLAGLPLVESRFPEMGVASFRQPVHLTYTGYVSSGSFYIALIVYQGQPMAVAEGEEIGPGIRIVRITPDKLEIAEPDSEVKAFPIEGDLS
ncbi:MAG: hypothetical protein SCM96_14260 [Acidobacteriota bacterium]|nr:hypothetical protein [Acidobacteriota bacterium]